MKTRLNSNRKLPVVLASVVLWLAACVVLYAQDQPAQPAGTQSTEAGTAASGDQPAAGSEAPAEETRTPPPADEAEPETPAEPAASVSSTSSELKAAVGPAEGEARPPEVPQALLERPPVRAGAEEGDGRISFNFNNASLDSVLSVIVRAAQLKFVKTAPLTGSVTISNLQPVTVDEAIDIVDAILHTQGSALLRDGDVLTVVPLETVKTLATPVYQGTAAMDDESLPRGAKVITWVQPLKNVDAARVARDLAGLVPKHGSLAANQSSNALIITDTGAGVQRLLKIVRQLDAQARGSLFDVRIFTLQYADATDVANVVRQIFVEQSQAQMGADMRAAMERMRVAREGGAAADDSGGAGRNIVKVAANIDTNSVVVAATPENLELIGKMVSQIDTVAAGSPQSVGIFHLENADPRELTNVLRTVLGLQVQAAPAASGQQQGRQRQQQPATRGTAPSGINRGTTNQPGRPSNTRPSSRGGASGQRSSRLDNAGTILVWPPSRVAQAGSTSDAAAGARPVRPGLDMEVRRARTPNAAGDPPEQSTAIRRKAVARNAEIVITYDERTGTVIVSAPEETMALIRSVIEELDRDPIEKYISQVYHLNNANSTDLASVMNGIFSGTAPGGEGIASELRGTVSVVADASSNSLIITSAPRNFDRIFQLVKDLDQAPPQVMIQAVLIEVTLNRDSKIGMVNTRLDFDKVLPQREYGFGDQTLFWSILNEKVDGFIELLQSQGSVEVLSRPQVLASDNKQAQINVGQSVPFVTRVQTTESGNTINTIQYQDIGILLNVTPHINPEGYVNMDIAPEISGFADSTVNVGENIQASVFTNRSAQTTVAIQDGQTIVIGGLMTNEDRKTVREVPVLSKIPLLGPLLFKRTETSKVKTDLLIIITPKVVRSPEAAARLSSEERERSSVSTERKTEEQMRSIQTASERFGPNPSLPPAEPQAGEDASPGKSANAPSGNKQVVPNK